MSDTAASDLIHLTAELVSAFVSKNSVPTSELPGLISSVHASLGRLGTAAPEPTAEPLKPFVPVKKSVTDEYIISLEDGRRFKSMKRYLTGLGMTPEDYRAKWGLPADYPMVAPAYAKMRSEFAQRIGLGRKAEAAPEPAPVPVEAPVAKKRGRAKAA